MKLFDVHYTVDGVRYNRLVNSTSTYKAILEVSKVEPNAIGFRAWTNQSYRG